MQENTIHICATTDCQCPHHKRPYVPIHIHSSSSLLDGVSTPKELVAKAKEYGHPGLSLTDHGNPSGLFDFYREAKLAGVKPILGLEFYLAQDLTIKEPNKKREVEFKDKHQTVLIKNTTGYKHFNELTYRAYTEGFYYKPRISYDQLFEKSEGLIVTSGCAASMFNQLLNVGKEKEAEEWFKKFVTQFGDDFYGEIHFNEITDKDKFGINQMEMNTFIIKMCNKYHVPILIGGDAHYADKEDVKLQDIMIACQRRKDGPAEEVAQESFIHARHLYYHPSEDYFKFNKEFGYNYDEAMITEALDNSIALLNKIDFQFEFGKSKFPRFILPTKVTADDKLAELCWAGLVKKLEDRKALGEVFSDELVDRYEKQLEYELEVFKKKDISDYFLIVQDVVQWANNNDIPTGIARGSAGGSLAAYACNITRIDPIQHNLIFERFINLERQSMPDIDCDFGEGHRGTIRQYLETKYGKESVLGVSTHGLYGAKSALQDTSRGLNKDTSRESVLMTEVCNDKAGLGKELEEETDLVSFFQDIAKRPISGTLAKWIKENQETIYWANKMIGRLKNHGTHAGGILITDGPAYNYIPVTKGGKEVVTAFKEADGSTKDLSDLGLLKLDVLGLKTLNVIHQSIKQIKAFTGKDITNEIQNLNLEDPKLYELVRKRAVYGVFQLDGGAGSLIEAIKPTRFEDIIAISSLNRPGPKDTFGPIYARWKRHCENGQPEKCKEDREIFPRLDFMQKVLEPGYFCMIHQEDFMFMVREAADFNLGEADNFRRAIAWREDNPKYHTVKKYFDTLKSKMLAKGYSEADVDYFVEYCRKFSGYSFNKAHSAAYAFIAMQCAYLKVYYPAYFYANLANVEDHDAYREVISSALADGIEILPPSITRSSYDFTVEDGKIRIGIKALKGLGASAFDDLVSFEIKPTSDIYEVLTKPFKKTAFECLVNSGCFDEFGLQREKLFAVKELYRDTKIEKWFTRKKGALSLANKPASLIFMEDDQLLEIAMKHKDKEQPNIHLVNELIPFIVYQEQTEEERIDLEDEILGFSLNLTTKLNELIVVAAKYPELNLQSLTTRTTEDDLCYFFCLKKTIATTKNGKQYLTLEVTDRNITLKIKCWDVLDIKKGKAYVAHLKQDKYGYTLINDDFLTEIEL